MIMVFVLFLRQVAVLFELYGRGNGRYEDPYAVDRDALLLIHPYRVRYGLREAQTLDGILDFLPYRLVDDLVDILFAEVGQRLAYDIFYLVVALYRTVERILVQRGACAVARDDDRPAVVAGYYAAAFAQPLFVGFDMLSGVECATSSSSATALTSSVKVGHGLSNVGLAPSQRRKYSSCLTYCAQRSYSLRPMQAIVMASMQWWAWFVRSFSESSCCNPHIFLNSAVVAPLTVYMRSNTLLR